MNTSTVEKSRRQYNSWVANESLEDYALRYSPASFRKWSPLLLANTALGGISFLALEAIGAVLLLNYGYTNAVWAIALASLIILLAGIPISYYAARYNIDIDLLTRSAGFGYVGSTITSLVYASFCFIFFALEAAIMAQALKLYFGLPLALGYILCSLVIIPIVFYGVTAINRLHRWTQPLWLVLMLTPFYFVLSKNPEVVDSLMHHQGDISGSSGFDPYFFGIATGISFSLIAQIGEQVDYLRFMPDKHKGNRFSWWFSMLAAGPGWIVLGCLKQLGGVLLASVAVLSGIAIAEAKEPVQMYYIAYQYVFDNPGTALTVSTLFVIVSQIKINVTNAYAGSLAWSNFFSRVTHSHPGRVVWLVFNTAIALLLMELGVFDAIQKVLGLYSNVAIAWIAAVVADLTINKPFKLSPPIVEFKRAHLFNYNPVGFGSMTVASILSIVAFTGVFGQYAQAYSWLIALVVAFVLSPAIALYTRGKYYIARENVHYAKSEQLCDCGICDQQYAQADFAYCPHHQTAICSLCCTLDSSCHDKCKPHQPPLYRRALTGFLARLFKGNLSAQANSRIAHFTWISGLMLGVMAMVFWLSYSMSGDTLNPEIVSALRDVLYSLFLVLAVLVFIAAWWMVLAQESQALAETVLEEQNRQLDIKINERDAALKSSQELLEKVQRLQDSMVQSEKMAALGGLVAGVAHEINTPVGIILMSSTHLEAETAKTQTRYQQGELSGDELESYFDIATQSSHLITLNSQRAADLIHSFKQVAVDQSSGERREFKLKGYIDEILLSLQPTLKKTQIGVELECPEDLTANNYPGALSQVLTNFIMNSLLHAYRPDQTGTLRIRVRTMPDDQIEIVYSDDGQGIPSELLPKIFEPFYTTRRGNGGSGLGLHIVYNIVRQTLRGQLHTHSVVGQGTTFTIAFPRVATDATAEVPAH